MDIQFDLFTDRTKKIMSFARQEARRLKHSCIGVEHILLGIVYVEDGLANAVLMELGVSYTQLCSQIEKLVPTGTSTISYGQLAFNPESKKVLYQAMEEARNLGDRVVGTEHLLLGLVREKNGIAFQVLSNFGLTNEDILAMVFKFLGVGYPVPPATTSPPTPTRNAKIRRAVKVLREVLGGLESSVSKMARVRARKLRGAIDELESVIE